MTYFDHNRPQEPYQSAFHPPEKVDVAYPVDEEDDRVYTEEDYAMPADGDAFLPDDMEAAAPAPFGGVSQPLGYAGFFDPAGDAALDDELLDEELLTEEDQLELRRSTWQLLAGLGDFAGVILGTAAILILIALLVSLINWLVSDISQTFTLWQIRL